MPSWRWLIVLTVASTGLVIAARSAPGQEADASIKGFLLAYVEAFNRQDADALAQMWAADALWIDDETGTRDEGREVIIQGYVDFFADVPEAQLSAKVEHARMITPQVAEFSGVSALVIPGREPVERNFTAILVNRDAKWIFTSVHESAPPSAGGAYEHLQPLDFLVGTWVDETDEASVRTTVRWGANQTFLVRSYVVESADQEPQQGTQVIGWDPRQQRIRSWNFDSDGSFGEATWTRDGQDWLGQMQQTLADGGVASATRILRFVDENTLEMETVGLEVDGQPLPSEPPVRVAREETIEPGEAEQNTPAETAR